MFTYILLILSFSEDYKSSHILHDILTARNDPLLVMILASRSPIATIASITLESWLVHAEARVAIVILLTVRVELWVVKLSAAELRQDLLAEATAALCHTRQHTTTIVSELSSAHEARILGRAEGLIRWTHLLETIMLTVLDAIIDSIRRRMTTEVLAIHSAAKARVTPMIRLGVSVRE